MEWFFRSLKTEWIPTGGYQNLRQAQNNIGNYITGDYSQVRLHKFNGGKIPNKAEQIYWFNRSNNVLTFT
jgi:putative transposase